MITISFPCLLQDWMSSVKRARGFSEMVSPSPLPRSWQMRQSVDGSLRFTWVNFSSMGAAVDGGLCCFSTGFVSLRCGKWDMQMMLTFPPCCLHPALSPLLWSARWRKSYPGSVKLWSRGKILHLRWAAPQRHTESISNNCSRFSHYVPSADRWKSYHFKDPVLRHGTKNQKKQAHTADYVGWPVFF